MHMRKKVIIILILFLFVGFGAFSDEISELLELLEDNVFSVNIVGRIYGNGNVSSWNVEVTKYTISGKKVSVKLKGKNLKIIADITPYADEKGILLLAQGQVWITSPGEETLQYTSTMKSLPIQFGDKVYFYPLGLNQDKNQKMFILELEIQVLPYKNIAQNGTE
jgi:hypothetical protein